LKGALHRQGGDAFFRVTSPQTVVIVPDTPTKRREYEEDRPDFLPQQRGREGDARPLRVVLDARRVSPLTASNAIAIRDTPERVAAAGLIAAIDKARPEVIVDVELLGRSRVCSNTAFRSRRPVLPA
jgi:hypothetical protein